HTQEAEATAFLKQRGHEQQQEAQEAEERQRGIAEQQREAKKRKEQEEQARLAQEARRALDLEIFDLKIRAQVERNYLDERFRDDLARHKTAEILAGKER